VGDQHSTAAAAVAKTDAFLAIGRAHPDQGVFARRHLAGRKRRHMIQRNADRPGFDAEDAGVARGAARFVCHGISL